MFRVEPVQGKPYAFRVFVDNEQWTPAAMIERYLERTAQPMVQLSDTQFAELLDIAREATLQSIAVWPAPTSNEDALKMFIEKITDDLEHYQ